MIGSGSDDTLDPQLAGMIVSIGDGALRYHVRDDEAMIRRLSRCELPSLKRDGGMRVDVTICPVVLWLPDAARAEAMDVPEDGRWEGWRWAANDYLLLNIYRNPDLPRLSIITFPRPGLWHLEVAGRPMSVWRASPGDGGWAAPAYLGEAHGFLDDATEFSAQAVAPTETRREELLAAVATLEHLPPGA